MLFDTYLEVNEPWALSEQLDHCDWRGALVCPLVNPRFTRAVAVTTACGGGRSIRANESPRGLMKGCLAWDQLEAEPWNRMGNVQLVRFTARDRGHSRTTERTRSTLFDPLGVTRGRAVPL